MDYKNKTGTVTAIRLKEIEIDGDVFFTESQRAQDIIEWSKVEVGDEVEFNYRANYGDELIYLRVTKQHDPPKKSVYQSAREFCSRESEDHVAGYYVGGGEMANMTLASHDPYDEWADGDTM
jgi:hypothetical protein